MIPGYLDIEIMPSFNPLGNVLVPLKIFPIQFIAYFPCSMPTVKPTLWHRPVLSFHLNDVILFSSWIVQEHCSLDVKQQYINQSRRWWGILDTSDKLQVTFGTSRVFLRILQFQPPIKLDARKYCWKNSLQIPEVIRSRYTQDIQCNEKNKQKGKILNKGQRSTKHYTEKFINTNNTKNRS